MSKFHHESLAAGRWFTFTLDEQLGNVGSEVSRMIKARGDKERYQNAAMRCLELLDLTISDPRWKGPRLKELCRVRGLFLDTVWGINEFKTSLEDLDKYFYHFAYASRLNR